MTPNVNNEEEKTANSLSFGKFLAQPPPGDEICITGMSGAFPNSENVAEFRKNLFNKVDMVCDDDRRWNNFHPEIPQRTGKIYNAEKFDPGFFGIHHQHVTSMDPMIRLVLEKAIESIFDAGIHPSELEGTRTGIFVGVCFAESEREIFYQDIETRTSPMLGGLRSILSHRLSLFLKVKGPSFIADTACSSSLFALENAYRSIRDGLCDMALVGGCNLCLHPFLSLQFARLGVLSTDGTCKSFDETGNGYCRSEAVSCVFLQKSKNSRRIYAKIVHAKTNCDGFKEFGISYPSREMQTTLLKEFYEECHVDPTKIGFVEAHGTGTKVGDPEEGATIDEVFCTNRESPLLVGSVKSNIGHTESASGLASVVKCIIALEEGYIPPNIHYSVPRKEIKGLTEGRMKVVVDRTPLPDNTGLVALSSFGFGGANAHVLLEWNHKTKVNGGRPNDDIPRLVCVSGRTPEAVSSLLDRANEGYDAEYMQLLHEIFKRNIECHSQRGYGIFSKTGQISSSCKRYFEARPTLLIAFGDFGNSWQNFAKQLLILPVFAQTIRSIHQILINTGINMSDILQNSRTLPTHPVVNNILGTVALQIGIIELLKDLKINPNAILGLATGEIACAYFDGVLTLEQAVLTALEIGNHLKDINKISTTYVVKFGEQKLLQNLPANVEITWKYSENAAAISGEPKAVHKFVTNLQEKGAQVFEIGKNDVTLHSKINDRIESTLQQKLKTIIPNRKPRSSFWLSTSEESTCSPEYFVKSLYSEVKPQNLISFLSSDTVILEIGLGKLSKLLNHARYRSLDVVSFSEEQKNNGLIAFLEILGNLYECGFNPQIQNLYPKVQYPVSRATPMISDRIKWKHSENWHVMKYSDIKQTEYGEKAISVLPKDEEWLYLKGHVIDGRNLFPATGYLDLVWETFAATKRIIKTEMAVIIENIRLSRATTIGEKNIFTVQIQKTSGNFEVIEGGVDIVSGTIQLVTHEELEQLTLPLPGDDRSKKNINMKSNDIYKELRLRGYHYKDAFKDIQECNMNATKAYIKWTGNWVSFMDNMLQMRLLQIDTRLLYVPTGFKRITIDAKTHLQYVESFGENPILPVYIYKEAGIIRCGGIEIRGLSSTSIARKKQIGQPVLERYEFVPNETTISLVESVRVNMQIALENVYGVKVNASEVIDEATKEGAEPLGPYIFEALSDQPLIQANITIFSKQDLEIENVTVEKEKTLSNETDCLLVIGTNILQRPNMLIQAFRALKENGFILSREELDFDPFAPGQDNVTGIDILTIHATEKEKLVFLRKSSPPKKPVAVEISETDEDFNWLAVLQKVMKSSSNIIIYTQNEETNGLLGLYNCIRREAGGTNVQCVLLYGNELPSFDLNHPFYQKQLNKNMSVNIYKDGKWGTYRHLLMREAELVEAEHCFVNQTTRGDLSSLKLMQGHLNSKSQLSAEKILVQVYYASINFRDIMTASGRINADVITMDRVEQECVQGFEFAGRDPNGRRVMGLASAALSTIVSADSHLLFKVPDNWTMEEAATVPAVYATVLYALFERGKIRKGESILIHSGSGGIGQAAIHVALAHGCNVFTTVGTPEKKKLIKKLFPQLTDRQIGNSRDSTFEIMVKSETKGQGVDVVLNSLAEEKLVASVRCLAKGGRFLEIGKFDIANDNRLALMLFEKECSFHGVMLDQFFHAPPSMKKTITSLLTQGLNNGMVKPLTTNVFQINEVEEAFRFMSSGKHTGKVLIQIREEELQRNKQQRNTIRNKGLARFSCDPEKSYVILGGLGGFGLELADWLVLRGARKLLLNSRTGVSTGYQSYRLNIWRSYGVIVKVSTADVTTRDGCEQLITEAEKLGPIDGLFNLAVVLKDSILENQTAETFKISFGPKTTATKYLDDITRRRCSQLRHFVIFSSVSCGRGNAGQTNYGMANSAMERICERRRKAGYPALAIEWGAVGDVGLVAEMQKDHVELDIGGTLQQRISSCLQVMDTFLVQNQATIVSSMVVAEKKRGSCADNIVYATANIIGIKTNTVSPHATLAELGMDSMTAVEIKQTLEREFEVFLSPQDIRSLTFARLQEIQDARYAPKEDKIPSKPEPTGFDVFLQNLGDSAAAMIPVVRLPSLAEDNCDAPLVFVFPGIEGYVETLRPLAAQLKAKVIGLQCCYKVPPINFITTAEECLAHMNTYLKSNEFVNIVSFSWGTIIALEVTARLEKKGHTVHLIILDGAPEMVVDLVKNELKARNETELHVSVLCLMMLKYYPPEVVTSYKDILAKYSSAEQRLEVFLKALDDLDQFTPEFKRTAAIALYARVKETLTYKPTYEKIMAPTIMFKPTSPLFQTTLPDDYNLAKICSNFQGVKHFEGNHVSILENALLAEAVNDTFSKKFF